MTLCVHAVGIVGVFTILKLAVVVVEEEEEEDDGTDAPDILLVGTL